MAQNWYKKTEAYLHHYKEWRGRLEIVRQEIADLADQELYPAAVPDYSFMPRGSSGLSTTERYGILRSEVDISAIPGGKKLMDELVDLRKKLFKVEVALKILTEREYQLVELRYFRGLENTEVWDKLGLSRTAYFELKGEVIAKLARCMGFMECG